MSPRRQLTLVVLGCAAAAGLALVVADRPWEAVVTVRPVPLPELRTVRTGGDLRPWLPALAWVGLAGAGALLATRAAARRLVGGLLVLTGAGLATGALTALSPGRSLLWPVLTGLAGAAVAGAGAAAGLAGQRWPALGARYQRPAASGRPAAAGHPTEAAEEPPTRPDELWDALDRGEDPTAR